LYFRRGFRAFPGFHTTHYWVFDDPTVGIVQTPQHFYNKDPIQTNLSISRDYPDEQRLFFDEMAASRDAWDVAFCCGSCSIQRRSALDAIGGVPTEIITEDLLSTLVMLRKGYRTRYLNERLSMGLAPSLFKGSLCNANAGAGVRFSRSSCPVVL
jgi:cellulose synthase (UDP-forming)